MAIVVCQLKSEPPHDTYFLFSGTGGSIWLNGDYPVRVGQRVSAPVCVRTSTECCKSTWDIEIKKCHIGGEDFFLHRLSAVPSCPMSYCAGSSIDWGRRETI